MSDLISRVAAICCLGNSPEQMCMPWSEVERMLRELPAVDAMPVVHGYWIIYPDVCVCSECNKQSPGIFKYCPNCGATMEAAFSGRGAYRPWTPDRISRYLRVQRECNEDSPSIFRYCPNCGATMDEEAKEGAQ